MNQSRKRICFKKFAPRNEDHFVRSAAVLGFVLEVEHAEPGVVFWQGAKELVEVLSTKTKTKHVISEGNDKYCNNFIKSAIIK